MNLNNYNIYIYDIEVFQDDWIVVFRKPQKGSDYIVFHNDNYGLKNWLKTESDIIGGFNNKHYDDYVIKVMLNGGSNVEVKRCNDWIISGNTPWEFPFIQFTKKTFKSFDLRDDIADIGISLKAIEGNLKLPIIESSIPFDIDRKLTPEELEEVIKYCKHDVDSTCKLYWQRKQNYLDAKVLAGGIYGIDPLTALSLTNAKLSALALEATYTDRDDERDYIIPKRLNQSKIPEVILDFFLQIRDKSIPDAKLFGAGKSAKGMTLDIYLSSSYGRCPITYAWGGFHGAKPCVIIEETADRLIILWDVGSLYPNSMINFEFTSRSMKDPKAYKKLVDLRLDYKAKAKAVNKLIVKVLGSKWYHNYSDENEEGYNYLNLERLKNDVDDETYNLVLKYIDYDDAQSSLKLIINTCYGAMLAKGNGLNDRRNGRSVCITNQLAMTILVTLLCESCETIDFININTDGIMFSIDKKEVDKSTEVVNQWCKSTGFTMEREDFQKVIQKDVNNYIGIYKDGHFKAKGSYVKCFEGGNFKANSLQIIHKAIVDYFVYGTNPEITIRNCKEVTAFQQIIKTGGTFNGSYWYVDNERIPVQKVNRIYAVKNPKYGKLVKGKWITEKRTKNKTTGKMDVVPVDPPKWSETTISECPTHCFIDNENTLSVSDLDLNYYIEMAKRRINKYITIDSKTKRKLEKIKTEVVIMATPVKAVQEVKVVQEVPRNRNVFSRLAEARIKFRESKIEKKGINKYAKFEYFRLEEIIPVKQEIFKEVGLIDVISFGQDTATLTLYNTDDPNEHVEFTSQLAPDESMISNPIQKVGAVQTYVRRYLYLLALDIIESDTVDAVSVNDESVKKTKSRKPVTEEERKETKKELINSDGSLSKTQEKALMNGLRKLRNRFFDAKTEKITNSELEVKYSKFIKSSLKKIKSGKLTKTEAEDLLIEIGKKIAE